MSDDKQMLILASSAQDLDLDVELTMDSESPYCTTTTGAIPSCSNSNVDGMSPVCDKFNNYSSPRSSGHSHPHHHHHSPSVIKYSDRLKNKFSFSLFGSNNPRISQRISTISSNFLNYSSPPKPNQRQLRRRGDNYNGGASQSMWSDFGCLSCCCPLWVRRRVTRWTKIVAELWSFHWRMIVSSSLTVISSAGCLISFPIHLQGVTRDERSDGFSACFSIATILLLLFLLIALGVKLVYFGGRGNRRIEDEDDEGIFVMKPIISWKNILKIGFSVGLSVLSICSAWEDNKVVCNFQDPLLGLVIIFAIITHSVSKWRHVGFKRAFSLVSVAAGVFISVDYMLVDEHRCRGHYYTQGIVKDIWTWKVHLVWTLAFIVAIWLWTVAMFCVESVIPYQQPRGQSRGEELNAVKMTFLRLKPNDGQSTNNSNSNSTSNHQSVIETLTAEAEQEPDLFTNSSSSSAHYKRYSSYDNPYSQISYMTVFNIVLWFHISTWVFVLSLFWTEFIPGFGIGRGTSLSSFASVVLTSFDKCFHEGTMAWCLIISLFVYSQSFTYLILLLRSTIIAICVSCLGFPLLGLWWSVFQMNSNFFVWMPAYNGELICAFVGLPLIFGGTAFMFKLDILQPNRIFVGTPN